MWLYLRVPLLGHLMRPLIEPLAWRLSYVSLLQALLLLA